MRFKDVFGTDTHRYVYSIISLYYTYLFLQDVYIYTVYKAATTEGNRLRNGASLLIDGKGTESI